jgi:hypothetical protein
MATQNPWVQAASRLNQVGNGGMAAASKRLSFLHSSVIKLELMSIIFLLVVTV